MSVIMRKWEEKGLEDEGEVLVFPINTVTEHSTSPWMEDE